MPSYAERMERQDRIDRTVKTARTYLRKAEDFLYAYRAGDEVVEPPKLITSWYWDLLDQAIAISIAIVERLPDDWFESTHVPDLFGLRAAIDPDGLLQLSDKHNSSDDRLEAAEKLVATIKKRRGQANLRRKLALLEDHTGRTPEEAAAFQAKADELREKGNR